jgi:predicted DNA-binding transcriptional regulator AlpA
MAKARKRRLTESHQPHHQADPSRRYIGKRELLKKLPLSYVSIWKRMKRGSFPAPVVDGGKNYWCEEEIDNYLARLPKRSCYPK